MDISNFKKAFDNGLGSCRAMCNCGREYYNSDGGWSWDDQELEELEKNPAAYDISYAVISLSFEGKEYVQACECWHARAKKIMGFLDTHAYQIAEYLSLEKERKIAEAEASVIVR